MVGAEAGAGYGRPATAASARMATTSSMPEWLEVSGEYHAEAGGPGLLVLPAVVVEISRPRRPAPRRPPPGLGGRVAQPLGRDAAHPPADREPDRSAPILTNPNPNPNPNPKLSASPAQVGPNLGASARRSHAQPHLSLTSPTLRGGQVGPISRRRHTLQPK